MVNWKEGEVDRKREKQTKNKGGEGKQTRVKRKEIVKERGKKIGSKDYKRRVI